MRGTNGRGNAKVARGGRVPEGRAAGSRDAQRTEEPGGGSASTAGAPPEDEAQESGSHGDRDNEAPAAMVEIGLTVQPGVGDPSAEEHLGQDGQLVQTALGAEPIGRPRKKGRKVEESVPGEAPPGIGERIETGDGGPPETEAPDQEAMIERIKAYRRESGMKMSELRQAMDSGSTRVAERWVGQRFLH